MNKLSKKWAIVIGAAAMVMIVVIIILNLSGKAKERDAEAIEAMANDTNRKLYALKETELTNKSDIDKIIALTQFYVHDADIEKIDIVKTDDHDGVQIYLVKKTNFDVQTEELKQQANITLLLVPDLEYVEYQLNGKTHRTWRQFGEESGGNIFVVPSDAELKQHVEDGYKFQAYMDEIRPLYTGQGLSEAIGKYLSANSTQSDPNAEFCTTAHNIISAIAKDGKYEVYALVSYGEYRFMNGNLVRLTELNVKPTVFTFVKNSKEYYDFVHADFPTFASDTEDAVRKMYIRTTAENVMKNMEIFKTGLLTQEKEAAEKYLKAIGRNAVVGTRSDFTFDSIESQGVSEEAAGKILADQKLLLYPMWIGNQEFVQDGVRYVYETSYNKSDDTLLFRKIDYLTKKNLEEWKVSAATGEYIG